MLKPEIITTILLSTVGIFLLFSVFGTFFYEKKLKSLRLEQVDQTDWLFKGIHDTVFDIFYKGKENAEKLCGIDRLEYIRKCKIIHRIPQFKAVVAMRTEAVIIAFVFLAMAYITSYNMVMAVAFILVAIVAFLFLWYLPEKKMENEVENKLFYVKDDLPRFLSLLEKAMDLPIDQAMVVTASRFDSPLSGDIIDSINKVSLGANGWQETLMDLAKTYQIEDFSDLVLEIVNSYEQGVNIRPMVTRKAYEIEQNRMYNVESHDARIKTMIYIPIILLKILPLMALICLPMLADII